jgi:membrane-associated PAP2 superfamily phosphatase
MNNKYNRRQFRSRGMCFLPYTHTVEHFHVKSLFLKQATVCPALKTRKLLIDINLELINTFINFYKFINFEKFHVSTAVIL